MKILTILTILILNGYIWYETLSCQSKGGVTVVGIGQFHCVDKSVIK